MVKVKYSMGSGSPVYITQSEAQDIQRFFDTTGFNGTVDIRGAGPEAKVEAKPNLIRVLQSEFPDLICGAEYEKSNGKLSIRLSENSKAADKINATMNKVGDSTKLKDKPVNEELVSKINDFFKIS